MNIVKPSFGGFLPQLRWHSWRVGAAMPQRANVAPRRQYLAPPFGKRAFAEGAVGDTLGFGSGPRPLREPPFRAAQLGVFPVETDADAIILLPHSLQQPWGFGQTGER